MTDNDSNQFLQSLTNHISNVTHQVEQVNANLRHHELEELRKDSGSGSLNGFFQKEPNGTGMFTPVEHAIRASLELIDHIEQYRSVRHSGWESELFVSEKERENELKHERDKRREERKDLWWLWIQQTTRWVAGATLVVLMYSGAVWLSNHSGGFIKVPVKDWISGHDNLKQ